jgi:hypothetical protein
MEMRFLGGELLPYEIGINDWLRGYDESHEIHDPGQCTSQAQNDAGKQSDRHAISRPLLIGLYDHVLRHFGYACDRVGNPVGEFVTDFFRIALPGAAMAPWGEKNSSADSISSDLSIFFIDTSLK